MQTFEQLLDEWQDIAAQAKRLATKERALRDSLVAAAFPTPKVGVNSLELADGRLIKATVKITTTIDQDAALEAEGRLIERGCNAQPFKIKRDLDKKVYDSLSDEMKAIVDEALTRKPGAPTLAVV